MTAQKYVTQQGDTWDLIALRLWPKLGAELLMTDLIEANLEHVNRVIFSANITLRVPEIELPVVKTLPPWLR